MKKNLFLNNKYLVKWTENGSAFLVQSPFNAKAGIWWPKSWFQLSPNWPDKYFSTGIVFDQSYDEIIYCDKGIKTVNKIQGEELYKQFQFMVKNNKLKYLKMAMETVNQLNQLSNAKIKILPSKDYNQININQLNWPTN